MSTKYLARMFTACFGAAVCFAPLAAAITPKTYFATNASADAFASFASNNRAFFIQGIATDLAFVAPGHFSELANGTATLAGTVTSASNPSISFLVSMDFSGRVDVDPQTQPPAGSPKLDLLPNAYSNNGGPVDPGTWHYYTNFTGTLIGLGAMDGAKLTLVRMGPSWQVGAGASGINIGLGMSGWMTVTTVLQPTNGPPLPTTFNADGNMNLQTDDDLCADTAMTDATYSVAFGGHALWLPGAGGQFQFDSPGQWVMNQNGTAKLTGLVKGSLAPNCKFLVDIDFSGMVKPGDVNYPPAGSPHRELLDAAYIYNGGPVNPATWMYFTSATGVITGTGDCAGATMSVKNVGPAFQVGLGANGKNIGYGASGWFDFTLLTPPTNPNVTILSQFQGDGNIDLRSDCIDNPPALKQLTATPFGNGCPGAGGFVPNLTMTGNFVPGGQALLTLDQSSSNTIGLIVVGFQQAAIPLGSGCTLNVSPVLMLMFGPFPMIGAGPGMGKFDISLPLPLTFTPGALTMEGFVDEGGGLFANSNGLQITIQ